MGQLATIFRNDQDALGFLSAEGMVYRLGEATLAGEDVREFRIPFDEIARRLWAHMLDDLFKDVPVE